MNLARTGPLPGCRARAFASPSALPLRNIALNRGVASRERLAVHAAALHAAQPGTTKIGFVGIGIMGLAMANNLIKAGYDVTVWNRSPDRCAPLVAAGAKAGASPKAVAAACDITFAMLADPAAALAVATGPDGIAAGMGPGKGYVDVSTVDAATSAAVSAAVRATGASFLEAPVSGSKAPAEQGKLIFLAAGDRELYDASAAPLDAMGKARFYLGEVGAGARMKLVVNMIMGSMMASFAEGLSLAEASGLQPKDVIEILGLGAIAAPMFAAKGPTMVSGAFAPAFPLKHQQKDLRLALALGSEVKQPLAVAAAANELYVRAAAAGRGDDDFSAVLLAVAQQQREGKQ